MSYIGIPSFDYQVLNFDIILKSEKDGGSWTPDNDIYISQSLHHYLSGIKQQIDKYNDCWDNYKKITNPYEYIHTHVSEYNISICKYKPLSRSFFKMIEIIDIFGLLHEKHKINSFHLAEGPGGFIEAFCYKRLKAEKHYKNDKYDKSDKSDKSDKYEKSERKSYTSEDHDDGEKDKEKVEKNDKYIGMTLISDDINIPSWKKSQYFINNNKQVKIEVGASKTGNLFLKENLLFCYEKYGSSMEYITGDGGFDFSVDFNKQEELSTKLVVAQILFALVLQKKDGIFILKIFDVFKFLSIELFFLLSICYENVFIYKPYTSRIANSEKYIICKKYKPNTAFIGQILDNFDYIISNVNNIYTLLNKPIPKLFIKKIEEINAIYGQQQIENINYTLNLIREYINIKNGNSIKLELDQKIRNETEYMGTDNVVEEKEEEEGSNEEADEEIKTVDPNKSESLNLLFDYSSDEEIKNKTKSCFVNTDSPPSPFAPSNSLNGNFLLEPDPCVYKKSAESNLKICIDTSQESHGPKEFNTLNTNVNANANTIANTNTKIFNEKMNINKFNNKLNTLKNINIQKSITWCSKHQMSINKHFL
jgi:23S rRNA U2552 (ribose-2'-O)-methylase RlmE/FtsJ